MKFMIMVETMSPREENISNIGDWKTEFKHCFKLGISTEEVTTFIVKSWSTDTKRAIKCDFLNHE